MCQKMFYSDVLDNIVNKCNYTYHNTFKIKPSDVKSDSYAKYNADSNAKDAKFEIDDYVHISKYKNISAEGYACKWSKEVFVIKKVKNNISWIYVINDLSGKEIIGTFYEKEMQKTNQEEFRVEKIIIRKGHMLCIKWKGYDNSFNSFQS